MKFLIVFAALCAIAFAAEVEIVHQESEVGVEGFKFGVETSDGSKHSAEGVVKNVGSKDEALSVHGTFSYVGSDGVPYTVNYVADENGFQPEGAHLPAV